MVALDGNLLVYAFRSDLAQHAAARALVEDLRAGEAPWAIPGEVLASFLRLVTNPRVFRTPTSLEAALAFIDALRASASLVVLHPGPRHLDLFFDLCRASKARGRLVPDAWLAALAIEGGCTWLSCDHDFARFSGLDWRDPLAATEAG